ncbi:MAG: TIGR00730 family Rossman fold protein [Bacteroidota bacterium]
MAKLKTRAPKAYNNTEFLNSPDARTIRLISEFLEPMRRFRQNNVRDTIVFFGSARIRSKREATRNLKDIKKRLGSVARISPKMRQQLKGAEIEREMSRYYEDAVALSGKLTRWSKKLFHQNRFVVCSGGGPGIMEAANKGATLAKGRSIGLNISLPFEQSPNSFISDELNFEFHYFFMRKFWFVYLAKALIVFPGGFGTLDEMMEVLTLVQTRKLRKKIVVVLYGKEFWDQVINLEAMVRMRVISPEDYKLFKFADTPDEAFNYLVKELRAIYPNETSEQESSIP